MASGASWISAGMSMYSKMRSKRAIDDWTSVLTESIWPMGKNRRACSVVNATIAPGVSWPLPLKPTSPATR